MKRSILIAVATVSVLFAGLVHGQWTSRWGNTQQLDQAVARIQRVPMTLGDWQGHALELGVRQAERAEFAGYWLRRYERRGIRAPVQVMLACGRAGPLSVHTPDICYAGAGYQTSAKAPVVTNVGPEDRNAFWKATFQMPGNLSSSKLRIYWSWRTTDRWIASTQPRWDFAGQPVLFKMYVTREMVGANESEDDAACTELMSLLLPALDKTLAEAP